MAHVKKYGRLTPSEIEVRLEALHQEIEECPDPLRKLHLTQERIDLEAFDR